MQTKKPIVLGSILALSLVVLGVTYFMSGNGDSDAMQGRLSGTSTVKTTIKPTTTTLPMITVNYTTTTGKFAAKSSSTSNVSLGSFDIKVGSNYAALNNCTYQLGAYNNSTMYSAVYDSSTDPNPSFVKNVTMDVSNGGKYMQTESPTDVVYSSFKTDFTALPSALFAVTSGSTYSYKINSNVDENSELGVDAGDNTNYEKNTGYIYLTEITCTYNDSTGWSYYTWDANDSKGENSKFSVGSYDKGKGMLLTNVIIGN